MVNTTYKNLTIAISNNKITNEEAFKMMDLFLIYKRLSTEEYEELVKLMNVEQA